MCEEGEIINEFTNALNSSFIVAPTCGYDTLYNPQADARDVNQSPWVNLLIRGTKNLSIWSELWSAAIFLSDSTALSLTTVSSTVARLSKGVKRICAYSAPPTRGVNDPNCSARASSTSSSS